MSIYIYTLFFLNILIKDGVFLRNFRPFTAAKTTARTLSELDFLAKTENNSYIVWARISCLDCDPWAFLVWATSHGLSWNQQKEFCVANSRSYQLN